MKDIHRSLEDAIYAACFVTRLGGELSHSRPAEFSVEEWNARAVDIAIGAAQRAKDEVPFTTLAAIFAWARLKNASIRFQSNGTVSVRVNGKERRRRTLVEAWRAHVDEEGRSRG